MMKRTFVMIIFSLRSIIGVDWCSSDLECVQGMGRLANTMCAYKPQTETYQCRGIADVQTPDTRAKMLNLHNEYRNKLAGGEMRGWPQAANMMEMTWDDDVESVALRWAIQCVDGHDQCRRTSRFPIVGQNYAAQMASDGYQKGTNEMNFAGWVEEISMIADPGAMVRSFQGGPWGHLTQVIWAGSFKLGCGSVNFEKGGWKYSVDICNYGPAGNVITLPMYVQGEPASSCPAGSGPSKKYPNLCASIGDENGSEIGSGTGSETGSETGSGSGSGSGSNNEVVVVVIGRRTNSAAQCCKLDSIIFLAMKFIATTIIPS